MPVKRTDHKGRRLREGESQRKNLLYQYRYTDENGKRCTVYASDLKELREKEAEIQKAREDSIKKAREDSIRLVKLAQPKEWSCGESRLGKRPI